MTRGPGSPLPDLARAEPKTLHYRILHTAARLARSGRRLRIAVSWPWANEIATAWTRITALAQALTSTDPSLWPGNLTWVTSRG